MLERRAGGDSFSAGDSGSLLPSVGRGAAGGGRRLESPVGYVYSRLGFPSLAVRFSACPALRSLTVATAASNKSAPFHLLLAGLAVAGADLLSAVSKRVGRTGGDRRVMVFVLGPRRRGDVSSVVAVRIWSWRVAGSAGSCFSDAVPVCLLAGCPWLTFVA